MRRTYLRTSGIRVGKLYCSLLRLDIETFPNSSSFRSKEWCRKRVGLQYDDVAEMAENSSCLEPTSSGWSSLLTNLIEDVLRTSSQHFCGKTLKQGRKRANSKTQRCKWLSNSKDWISRITSSVSNFFLLFKLADINIETVSLYSLYGWTMYTNLMG